MTRIQQLSASVINKIAAGEVIERPSSVIKELLENSLDALATRIQVDAVAGGTELLRVVDDGEGIHPDDLLLAVTTHATSKIREADDLFRVQTMGFRGEALASISEVSDFRIRSRQPEAELGAELHVNLGQPGAVTGCGCPLGTQIEIRNLFANVPVRRRFLRTVSTEFGHISEQFSRVALANSRVHFVLRHNDRMVYELPATDRLIDRLRLFFGDDVADRLIWVESEQNGVRMWGYVGHPSQSKSTRRMQYLFLNGRCIQDRSLQHALTEAYRGLLMVGRQPISFLFVECPASEVDVNVHPTKVEVRFTDGQKLYRQLLAMLRNRFLAMELDSPLAVGRATAEGSGSTLKLEVQTEFADWAKKQLQQVVSEGPSAPEEAVWTPELPEVQGPGLRVDRWAASSPTGDSAAGVAFRSEPIAPFRPYPSGEHGLVEARTVSEFPVNAEVDRTRHRDGVAAAVEAGNWQPTDPEQNHGVPDGGVPDGARPMPPAPRSAGPPVSITVPQRGASGGDEFLATGKARALQIHDCYLVVETSEGLTVIDQHALHERILYEYFRERVLNGRVESQRLLVPYPVELSSRDAALIVEQSPMLKEIGFEVADFGGGTVLLEAYPIMLKRADLAELVKELAEQLEGQTRQLERRDLIDSMLHMMACKAAVKAGQRLSDEEIESLLEQRNLVDDAHHCPHGRPTALKLSRADLDRQFGRLG